MTVIDVGEDDFQVEVLDRSASVTVVVDFWAQWCAPCRALGPVLERAAAVREGEVVLAKLDGDANPNLVRYFEVHGIPAVKAFRDGEVVAEFVGARPAAEVESFFDAVAASQADALIAIGDEPSLRRALELEPRRSRAAVALARLVHEAGDSTAGLEILARLPGSVRARGAAARIKLERDGAPSDLAEAFAALDAGETARALDLLLLILSTADGHSDELRHVIAAALNEIGVNHPLAREWRRRLATLRV
ncbi:MAG: thioredoxin family protein [Solirubrobacteraceae bacterium]